MRANYKQIRLIHALKTAMDMDDSAYRAALSEWNVSSSKELEQFQATLLIKNWEHKAIKMGAWQPKGKQKYENWGGRLGYMATPAQLRMIEAMWAEVSYTSGYSKRAKALQRFIKRIVGIDDLKWLQRNQVEKIIKALQAMKKTKELKNGLEFHDCDRANLSSGYL